MLTVSGDLLVRFGGVIFDCFKGMNLSGELAMVDKSGQANTMHTYALSLESHTAAVETLQAAGGKTLWAAVEVGSANTLAWIVDGILYSVEAIVKDRKRLAVCDDLVKIAVAFEYNGTPTEAPASGPESLITLGIGSDAEITWLIPTGLHAEAV